MKTQLLVIIVAGLVLVSVGALTGQAGWATETVISAGNVGSGTCLAVDNDGYPHITYNGASWTWEYAYQDISGWHFQAVETSGSDASMTLDTAGYAHISYSFSDTGTQTIRYAYQDAGGWHFEDVDSTGTAGMRTCLALDSTGYPHICYKAHDTSALLQHAYKDIGGWHIETVDTAGHIEEDMAMDVDLNGYAHILYVKTMGNHVIGYVYEDAGGWHVETVDDKESTMDYAIAMDADCYPHVAYPEEGMPNLSYSYRDSGGWHHEIVDTDGYEVDIVLDSSGYPHISSRTMSLGLRYASKDAGGWHLETVDSNVNVGRHSSIDLDNSGFVHISYQDEYNADLKYAKQVPDEVPAMGIMGMMMLIGAITAVIINRKKRVV
ncbi:hypothetical protein K8T06_07020 [bacterium]|nr:hypothetical protein [bacterium]